MFVQKQPEPPALWSRAKVLVPLLFRLKDRSLIWRGEITTVPEVAGLVGFLLATSGMEATDERDHVFALLGLFKLTQHDHLCQTIA